MHRFLRSFFLIFVLFSGAKAGAQSLVADFSAHPLTGCPPTVDTFTDMSTGNPVAWDWNFGNGAPHSFIQNPTTSYSLPGQYTVTLTVTNASGLTNTKIKTNYITINPAPIVSFFASDSSICPGTTVNFTGNINFNNSTNTGTIVWNINGGTAGTANTSYTFNTPGTYTVSLSALNAVGCTTTVFKPNYITVHQPPTTSITASTQTICTPGGSTTFTAASNGTPPYTYSWNYGDGSPSTAFGSGTVTHSYGAIGTYPVTVITQDGNGCKDTTLVSNFISVVQFSPSFTGPATICEDLQVTFTNTSAGSSQTPVVSWHYGDGSPGSIGPTGVHVYNTPNTYNVTMVLSYGTCADSVTKTITVWPKPIVGFIDTPVHPCPAPATVQFINTTTGAATYSWLFGDNTSNTNTSPAHTYGNGFFDVVLIATSANGCTDSLRKPLEVVVHDLNLIITATPPEGCIPLTVHFMDSAVTTGPGPFYPVSPYPYAIVSRSWNFADGSPLSSAHNPTHIFTSFGTYPVTLTVTTANGCTVTQTFIVKAGTPPTAHFTASPDTACVHQLIQFTDQSTGTITDWLWQFGDGLTSVGQSPTHKYEYAGTYTVTLTVKNNGCGDSLQKIAYITILDPRAQFNSSVSCTNHLQATFTNTSLNATSSFWLFGDGTTSPATSPVHTYPALGTYTVTLITHNATTGCTDTTTSQILLEVLSPNFIADDSTVCKNTTVNFTSSVTGGVSTRYNWTIDGITFTDTTANIQYVFTTGGYHTIAITVRDHNNCYTTLTKTNYVIVGDPHAAWTANPPHGCTPATILFTDASTYPPGTFNAIRYWNFGNGNTATPNTTTISQTYLNAGAYDIYLFITDNIGCVDSLKSPSGILVHHVVADFSVANTNICVGVQTLFLNTSTNTTASHWDFGDGTTSTQASPLHAYSLPGIYTVKLVAYDVAFGCADSIVKTNYITVQAKPNAAFSLSDTFTICPPLIVQTTNTSTGGNIYSWDFGNTATSTLQNPVITYAASGIYDIRLIVTNTAGCKDTAKGRVRVLGYAGIMTYTPLSGCAPLTVTFTANNVSNVPGFIYDFADGTTQASASPTVTHTYTQVGPHLPTLILTDNAGCSSSSLGLDTIHVDGIYAGFTYNPYPACVSGTLTFIDTSHGAYSAISSHNWIFHDGTTASGISPTHSYGGPGTYPVTLITSTSSGCIDTLVSSVTFYNLPTIDAGPDTTICRTDSATLRPSGGVSYSWTPIGTLSCNTCTNPYAYPGVQTTYTVTGTDANGCKNTDTVTVHIKTKTDGKVGPGGEVCAGVPVNLLANGGTVYSWIPTTGLNNSHIANPIATPGVTTHYMVISKLASCEADTDYVDVIIHPLPVVDAGPSQTIIAGNAAQLNATGSAYITTWAWTPTESLSCSDCANPEATPGKNTTYVVVAKSDFDCEASDSVTIFVTCDNSQVFVPNTFTPNGNGHNDKFYIHGKGITTIRNFRVYDRWGEVVFSRQNINVNDEQNGWDGTFKGTALPPDIYVYMVEAICATGDDINWKGDVMLLR